MSNGSLESYPFEWKSDPFQLEMRIRWSIFIITGVCAGLPALVWSVSDIIQHRTNGHRISIFIILLLLTDFIELLLSPYILIKDLLNELLCSRLDWTCWRFRHLWWVMRVCGFLLNMLVTLEGKLSVKYPRFTASVFSSLCFRIVHILVFICVIIGEVLWGEVDFWVSLLIMVVSVISLIINCGASCSPERHSHTSRKPDRHILVIFLFTQLVFCLQYTFSIFRFNLAYLHLGTSWSVLFYIPVFLFSLRLISDPLLCVLVCRQNLSLQMSQKPEETSSV